MHRHLLESRAFGAEISALMSNRICNTLDTGEKPAPFSISLCAYAKKAENSGERISTLAEPKWLTYA